MNNPLSYQATEYDCGPVTLRNALCYLFDRKEIQPEVIKYINLYCLDGYNQEGEPCKNGTSAVAMSFLANWLNQFGQVKRWPIQCQVLDRNDIFLGEKSRITDALKKGGVAILRVILDCGHYVLMTGLDGEYVDVFDPYYWPHAFSDERILFVPDQPERMNRRIKWEVFNSEGSDYYNLGPVDKRECVLMFNMAFGR